MPETIIRGVIPAVLTPFSEDGRFVDEEALSSHVEWLVNRGVHGLFICGTNGEGPLLAVAERKRVTGVVVAQVRGRVPVLVQSGGITTDETIAATRLARAAGADGAAVVTPWYYAYDDLSLFEHYSAVASAVPDLPIFLYNIPSHARNEIKPALAARLMETHENIVGVKDSSKDLNRTEEFVDGLGAGHPVLVGTDSLVLAALSIGAAGAVAGVANVFPESMVALYDAYQSGDYAQARRLQSRVSALRAAMKGPAGVMLYKKALEFRGLKAGGPRRPARPATEAETVGLLERLRGFGVL